MQGGDGSASQSYFCSRVLDGEGVCATNFLDEMHGDEKVSFGQAEVMQGIPGGKVAEVGGEEGDEAAKRSGSDAAVQE